MHAPKQKQNYIIHFSTYPFKNYSLFHSTNDVNGVALSEAFCKLSHQ